MNAQRQISSAPSRSADAFSAMPPKHRLHRPGALIIATLAAFDVAYHLLLREPVRRMLGIRREV
jgi:hypothetical protein